MIPTSPLPELLRGFARPSARRPVNAAARERVAELRLRAIALGIVEPRTAFEFALAEAQRKRRAGRP